MITKSDKINILRIHAHELLNEALNERKGKYVNAERVTSYIVDNFQKDDLKVFNPKDGLRLAIKKACNAHNAIVKQSKYKAFKFRTSVCNSLENICGNALAKAKANMIEQSHS